MKTTLLCIIATALLLYARVFAEDKKPAESADPTTDASGKVAAANDKPTPDELEAKFKATLAKATMSGRWCSIKDGALGPEKADKYIIVGVTKLGGDMWIINARIQYHKIDLVAPIPVRIRWAGDTPVIMVDKIPIPGGGTYSARVMIYEHTYAGTWSGGDRGGLLNGLITNEKEDKPPEAK